MTLTAPPRPPGRPPPRPRPRYEPPPTPPKTWRPPWKRSAARLAIRDDLATITLTALTVVLAIMMGRLFSGDTWTAYGVGAVLASHGIAWTTRRLGLGLVPGAIVAAASTVLITIWLVVPGATSFGIPTPATFRELGTVLSAAQESWGDAVAPVTPTPGFVAAGVAAIAFVASLADWAAFRMRSAFEATVPALTLFIVIAVLGPRGDHWIPVALLAAAALLFLVVQRANLDSEHTAWFAGRSQGALVSLVTLAAALGILAVAVGVVAGPNVPGAEAKALVKLKGRGEQGPGTRSTVSPLVDIRGRLVEFANIDVFRVEADRPAYWRLTALDTFDGTIWSSNERYSSAKRRLAGAGDVTGSPLQQTYRVAGLNSIWLPAAYRPARLENTSDLSFSDESASLISRHPTSDGLEYTVESTVPTPSAEELTRAPPSTRATSGLSAELDRYLDIPSVSPRVRRLAADLTRGQPTPYEKALAIQNHLRSFTYSLDVPLAHSSRSVERFLFEVKAGYCEQFAGTYALLARLVGLPTRVAVGFQPGVVGADGRTYTVKDKDAHAWPEVYLEGFGWLSFEPTPGATGDPNGSGRTGVAYRSRPADQGPETTATTAPDEAAAAESAAQGVTTTTLPPSTDDEAIPPEQQPEKSWWDRWRWFVFFVGPVLLAGGGAIAVVNVKRSRRLTRRRRAGSAEERVAIAWAETSEALSLAGVRRHPSETLAEFRQRMARPGSGAIAGVEPGSPAGVALHRLADTVASTAYAPAAATVTVARQAEADRDTVVDATHDAVGTMRRLLDDIDPRPLIRR